MKKYETAAVVLYTIAKELAKRAIDSMPELREDEKIQREWYDDGVYYQETILDGKTYLNKYDFKQHKNDISAVG